MWVDVPLCSGCPVLSSARGCLVLSVCEQALSCRMAVALARWVLWGDAAGQVPRAGAVQPRRGSSSLPHLTAPHTFSLWNFRCALQQCKIWECIGGQRWCWASERPFHTGWNTRFRTRTNTYLSKYGASDNKTCCSYMQTDKLITMYFTV